MAKNKRSKKISPTKVPIKSDAIKPSKLPKDKKTSCIIYEVIHLVMWELCHHRTVADDIFSDIEENTVDQLSIGISQIIECELPCYEVE